MDTTLSSESASTIRKSVADAWRPRAKVSTADFVEQNISLSDEFEAAAGKYDLFDNAPWREPLEALHDPTVDTIAILKSTQVGGTLANIVGILATAELDPAPSMIVLPTRDDARLIRDRVYGTGECSSKAISNKVPPERLRNLIAIDLETCQTYLAWSGSKQRTRGKACKYVWLSEIDVYETGGDAGDPDRAAERRTDQFPDSTIVRESTPVGDDSKIADHYDASDKRKWHVQCPHCSKYQPLRFFVFKNGEHQGCAGLAGYRDKNGNLLDEETARANAHYVCVNGCKITNEYKRPLLRSGVWVPDGQWIDENGELQGKPNKSGRRRGYHLWQIFNPQKSFGDIVAEFLNHQSKGQIREFFQDVLGLRFRSSRAMPKWETIGRRLAWPDQNRGFVPPEVWFLTCGCDVQDDRVYFVVRGWAPHRTSWLIDWGEFYRDLAEVEYQDEQEADEETNILSSDILQVDHLLDRVYPVMDDAENPRGLKELKIRLLGIDSNHRVGNVHDYFVERGRPERLRLVRGDHHVDPRERFRHNLVEKNTRTGEAYEGGMDQWGIYVDYYKQLITDRLAGSGDKIGEFYVTADAHLLGQKYLQQLVNEPPTQVIDQKTGRKVTRFKPRSESIGVDFWDCSVYSEALADMCVGNLGWGEAAWKRQAKKEQRKKQKRRRRTQSKQSFFER